MKKIALLSLLLISFCFAQSQDRVDLKDGTTVSGSIKEYVSGEYVKIISASDAEFTFKFEDIKEVRFGKKIDSIPTKGFFNNTTMGFMLGSNANGYPEGNFSAHFINGYMFNPHFQVGLGLGLEGIDGNFYFPTFLDARWNFKKGRFTPFVGIQGGYAFHDRERGPTNLNPDNNNWSRNTQRDGGFMSGINFGIKNMVGSELGYTLSVGYRFQQLDEYYTDWQFVGSIRETSYLHRIDFKFGLTF
jgi:hypothetical protein